MIRGSALSRTEFKEDMESRCRSAYQAVEAVLYNMYQKSSSNIDSKLQDLFATLERIGKLLHTDTHAKTAGALTPIQRIRL